MTRFFPTITIFLQYPEEIPARVDMLVENVATTGHPLVGFEYHATPELLAPTQVEKTVQRAVDACELFSRGIAEAGGLVPPEAVELRQTIHAPFKPYYPLNFTSLDGATREYARDVVADCLRFGRRVGASVVNAHLNAIISRPDWEAINDLEAFRTESLDQARRSLLELREVVHNTSVTLALENVPFPIESIDETPPLSPYLGIFPGDFTWLFQQVPAPGFTYCFDICHAWINYKTARSWVEGQHPLSEYFGLFPHDADHLRTLAHTGPMWQLTPLLGRLSHLHLAETRGTYVPGTNTHEEGNPLDEGEILAAGFLDAVLAATRDAHPTRDFSLVLEIKERDYVASPLTRRSLGLLTRYLQEREKEKEKTRAPKSRDERERTSHR